MKPRDVSLVVGADGLMGEALTSHLLDKGEFVLETTRRPNTVSDRRLFLDLAKGASSWRPPTPVSVAYLCAGVSSLEQCRTDPAQSAKINIHSTLALAKTLVSGGTFVIFPSTNLVYDGSIPFRKAGDPVNPMTEYGRQKAEAERQLLALGDLVSVVRFTKVLGPDQPLLKKWLQALHNGEVIHPFSDMVMAPVSLAFGVEALHRIAQGRLSGIAQVSGEKDVTYEEVALHIAQPLGADPHSIQPVKSREANPLLESVPAFTTLDMERIRRELQVEPPDVWLTIDSVFGYEKEQEVL